MTVSLYALVMTFGALVAVAGLVLLFTRQDQGQSRIKIFNWEFQVSTPALVVFLAGCALFIILPALQIQDRDLFTIGPRNDGPPHDGNHMLINGEEKEPNDDPPHANLIRMESVTRGVLVTAQDRDFFKFQSPTKSAVTLPKVRVILRKMFQATIVIYNENEEKVTEHTAGGEETLSFAFEVTPGANYYLIIESSYRGEHGVYELLLKEE
jgi:hypothetical protein